MSFLCGGFNRILTARRILFYYIIFYSILSTGWIMTTVTACNRNISAVAWLCAMPQLSYLMLALGSDSSNQWLPNPKAETDISTENALTSAQVSRSMCNVTYMEFEKSVAVRKDRCEQLIFRSQGLAPGHKPRVLGMILPT